jgi:predicted nucleotidyltransferase component of viral defense system
MLFDQIISLVNSLQEKGCRNDFIINSIKEFLQIRVLDYVYNNKKYNKKLIFTGGTCLRLCFGLPRLSEDLDFDYEGTFDPEKLMHDIKDYFSGTLKMDEITGVIKGKGQKIYLKFNILKKLSLAYGDSQILYLKIEPTPVPNAPKTVEITQVNKDGLYFFVKRYSLVDLMSGKIHAFLMRSFYQGKENEIDFKGRDVFDLIWYMGQEIMPNLKRLEVLLKGTKYQEYSWLDILNNISKRLKGIKKQHLVSDLLQFIEDRKVLEQFLSNYLQVFEQYSIKYFGQH